MSVLQELQDARYKNIGFSVGERVPHIILPNAETGSEMSLADFHGQKVMLHIFASW